MLILFKANQMANTIYKPGDHKKDLERARIWIKQHKKPKPRKRKPAKLCPVEILTGLNYVDFLKTKYWQRIRKQILKRDNDTCQKCGSHVNLHVHHLTYKHHLIEHRFLGDMITLCKSCHEKQPNHSQF